MECRKIGTLPCCISAYEPPVLPSCSRPDGHQGDAEPSKWSQRSRGVISGRSSQTEYIRARGGPAFNGMPNRWDTPLPYIPIFPPVGGFPPHLFQTRWAPRDGRSLQSSPRNLNRCRGVLSGRNSPLEYIRGHGAPAFNGMPKKWHTPVPHIRPHITPPPSGAVVPIFSRPNGYKGDAEAF